DEVGTGIARVAVDVEQVNWHIERIVAAALIAHIPLDAQRVYALTILSLDALGVRVDADQRAGAIGQRQGECPPTPPPPSANLQHRHGLYGLSQCVEVECILLAADFGAVAK